MTQTIRVLVIDDDDLLRMLVTKQLSISGFVTGAAADAHEGLETLRRTDYDVVLLDIQMPGMSGIEALAEIRKMTDAPEVIMLTADASLQTGIEAMRRGAYDYLTKPSTLDEMETVIRKAFEKRRLLRQNQSLRAAVQSPTDATVAPVLDFKSRQMRQIMELSRTAARLDSTVVITGESGTGKDVLARFIHEKSNRAGEPFISVNCGAIPEQLFESEFFGHERGAFTGANQLKRGLIEAADGSTMFLDEIGDMPLAAQVKLLHFVEQGRFRRVGSMRDQSADVRIIAATNRQLQQEVEHGRFRADLFYRLSVISIHIPPLRDRPEDVPPLVEHFMNLFRGRFNRPSLQLSSEALARLDKHHWLGNVRELRNTLERAAALSQTDKIELEQMSLSAAGKSSSAAMSNVATQTNAPTYKQNNHPVTLYELERQHIQSVIKENGGNRERTAAILGISERTLYRKLREYETSAYSLSEN